MIGKLSITLFIENSDISTGEVNGVRSTKTRYFENISNVDAEIEEDLQPPPTTMTLSIFEDARQKTDDSLTLKDECSRGKEEANLSSYS